MSPGRMDGGKWGMIGGLLADFRLEVWLGQCLCYASSMPVLSQGQWLCCSWYPVGVGLAPGCGSGNSE